MRPLTSSKGSLPSVHIEDRLEELDLQPYLLPYSSFCEPDFLPTLGAETKLKTCGRLKSACMSRF